MLIQFQRLSITLFLAISLTLILLGLLFQVQPPAAYASANLFVAPNGNCLSASPCYASIQAAVDDAIPGDTILIATGTYTDIQSRQGYTQVVYIDREVTLRGGYTITDWITSDPVLYPTVLDAQHAGRGLVIINAVTATIEGLNIINGTAIGQGENGGGVYVFSATAILSGNVIYNNIGTNRVDYAVYGYGGGLYAINSNIALIANIFQNNIATTFNVGWGGGVYLASSNIALISNTIVGNMASSSHVGAGGGVNVSGGSGTLFGNFISSNTGGINGGNGGGLYLNSGSNLMLISNTIQGNVASVQWGVGGGLTVYGSDVTLISNIIQNNAANETADYYSGGGGLLSSGSVVTLTNNRILSNTSLSNGGGISLYFNATTLLEDNIIQGNVASACGGGLYIASGQTTLINAAVIDNQANTSGSGLCVTDSASVRLLYDTIARNGLGENSGIHIDLFDSVVELTNTILSNQAIGITATAGNTVTANSALWFGNEINTGGAGLISVTNAITGEPAFATDGYHLTITSSAINAGVNADIFIDIDGDPRPLGGGYDIGADEYLPATVFYLPLVLRNN